MDVLFGDVDASGRVEIPIIDIQALVEVDLWNGWVWVFI
jgi:hypothetical protein